MNTSERGIALIARWEGFSANAYPDPGTGAEPITIGYGTTVYPEGRLVKLGDTCTREQAEEWLRLSAGKVERFVSSVVKVPLSQNQFDALVCLTYNIGVGAFHKSTLLKKLNASDYAGAAEEFLRWNQAGGKVMQGLANRRESERELFLTADSPPLSPVGEFDADTKIDSAAKPAPNPMSEITPEQPVAPFLAAAIPSLIAAIPDLAKLLTNNERKQAVAETVAAIATKVTGSPNVQGAVEMMEKDSGVRQQVADAVRAEWYELVEVGGGIAAAREFNVAVASIPAWRMPALWISAALFVPVYAVVGSVLWGEGWTNEIRIQVVTAVLAVIGMVGSFWLGSSMGSAKKDDALLKR